MTNTDFLLVLSGPLAGFITGMVIFLIARREQRRFFQEHPELPSPFDKPHHHPAE